MSPRLPAAALAFACLLNFGATFANPCVLANGGMGGTGAPAAVASDDAFPGGTGGSGLQAQQGDGIGGTGARARADGDGIGGTGVTAGRDSGGIGGTGAVVGEGGIGGTGIVGVITGFGSICVGGVEIHYGTSTPISSDGRPMNATQLKIGHVVQVQARGVGDSVRAQSIELVHAVAGPVGAVHAKAGRLEVLGQPVRASARLVAEAQAAARAGHPVQVSGLRAPNGDIVATRVDAAPGLKEFGVIGPVREVSAGKARIGNLSIKLDAAQAREVREGQSLEICGPLDNGALRAHTIETKGAAALKGKVERLVIEGFVGRRGAGTLEVGDTVIEVDRRTQVVEGGDLKLDQRVVVAARVVDGKVVAERVERVRDRDHGGHGDSQGDQESGKEGDKETDGKESGGKESDGKVDEEKANKDADKNDARDDKQEGDGKAEAGKSDSSHGGGKDADRTDSARDANVSGSERGSGGGDSDARKAAERSVKDRLKREASRDARPPKDSKPDRPSGGSSHGGRPERIRDK